MKSRIGRLPGKPVIVATGQTRFPLPSEQAHCSSLGGAGGLAVLPAQFPGAAASMSCSGGWLLLLRVTLKPSGETWPEDSHVFSFI